MLLEPLRREDVCGHGLDDLGHCRPTGCGVCHMVRQPQDRVVSLEGQSSPTDGHPADLLPHPRDIADHRGVPRDCECGLGENTRHYRHETVRHTTVPQNTHLLGSVLGGLDLRLQVGCLSHSEWLSSMPTGKFLLRTCEKHTGDCSATK